MNKLKHTPGPWSEIFNGIYWDVKCQYELGNDVISKHNPNVAYCINNYNYEHTREHAEYNARLIAAAPDMLEVLINAYCNMDSGNFAEIESVVRKATGLDITKVLEILNEN